MKSSGNQQMVKQLVGQAEHAEKSKWWSSDEGLTFGCTGCGRCCQNDGVVWLDTDEFADLCYSLKLSHEEVLDKYSDQIMSGWVKLKNKPAEKGADEADRCIFLDEDGRKCTIYESRPVQCRTYPYWPKLLFNSSAFTAQAVMPDDAPSGPYWSATAGGCEGINHANATKVSPKQIHRNAALYEAYTDQFPFMESGDDKQRLLGKLGVISNVVKASRAWVSDFVLRYNLCPFAADVFKESRVRYRVFFGGSDDVAKVVERVRFEMLALLTAKEEDVATTLLMLPFAFSSFDDFHRLSLELEDALLPIIERELQGPLPLTTTTTTTTTASAEAGIAEGKSKTNRLLSRSKPKDKMGSEPDIQLAFFHPSFEWDNTEEFNSPINFEKRAPFPTINLLRAARIRDWANGAKTTRIANSNADVLGRAGGEQLSEEFERIIRLALE